MTSGSRPPSDVDDQFSTAHLRSDLRNRSVRGGIATVGSQAAHFVLTTISTVVLARLLTPADFGLIAMVAPLTGFVRMFSDLGLSTATIQRDQVTHSQVSTLFWVNLGVSMVLAVTTMALAPVVGLFYGDPRVVPITVALAALFVFGGVTAQQQAVLQRQMRFGVLGAIHVAASAMGVFAGILGALAGLDYWSLVLMNAVTGAAGAGMMWVASSWRPGRPVRGAGTREMLRFGGGLTGFNIVNYLARNADDVLIGRFLGAAPLGYYTKAYALLLLPVTMIRTPISQVAITALSQLQHEPERYRRYVRKALSLITFLSMPLIVFSAWQAENLVLLALGSQWLPAVPVFRVLSAAAFVQSFNVVTGWVYTSLGRTGRWFRWGVLYSAVTVLAFVIGLRWGIEGVAICYSASVYLLLVPSLMYCFSGTFVRISDVFSPVWRSVVIGLVAAAGSMGISQMLGGGDRGLAELGLAAANLAVLYVGFWFVVPGGRSILRDFRRIIHAAVRG